MEFLLLDADYKREGSDYTGNPVIRLFGRKNGSRQKILVLIRDYHPYIYVHLSKEELAKIVVKNENFENWIVKIDSIKKFRYFKGEKLDLWKITGRTPWNVPQIRNFFPFQVVFEADMPFIKRFLIDTGLKCFHLIKVDNFKDSGNNNNQHVIECSYSDLVYAGEEEGTIANLMYMAFDIEVDVTGESITELLDKKNKKITAISGAIGSNEKELLDFIFMFLAFLEQEDPDIIAGYNSDLFDWPYLINRMEKRGISTARLSLGSDKPYLSQRGNIKGYRITGRIITDLSRRTRGIHPITGRKGLDDISRHLFGDEIGKIRSNKPLGDLYRQNLPEFEAYSRQDGILTYRLIFSLGIPESLELLKVTGYPSFDGVLTTERNNGEFELMRRLYVKNILIPSRPTEEELRLRREYRRTNPHKGGYVRDPKPGIHEQVLITDFASMYPSLIVSYNIGHETIINEQLVKDDPINAFNKEHVSCLASLQKDLLARRKSIKRLIKELEATSLDDDSIELINNYNRVQRSLKLVSNSLYGSHTFIHGRFHSATIADAITEIGRYYLENIGKWIKAYPVMDCEMVYGDTDSAFIKIDSPKGLVKQFYEEKDGHTKRILYQDLRIKINDLLQFLMNYTGKDMHLEQEDIALRIAFAPKRKKAYAYLSALSGKVIIKGFEAVRRDWSPNAREFQKELLELLLSINDLDMVREFVMKRSVGLLKKKSLDKGQFTILAPVRGGPKSYKSMTPGVSAYLHWCRKIGLDENEEWRTIDAFPFIIKTGSGPLYTKARHPNFVESNDIDKQHYISEILRSADRFGVRITFEEVYQKAFIKPIPSYFVGNKEN
ncbi:MAG: DNA polymerase domain-containing protein [Candidatus Hodarchaeales archaeon]|jgi:DNA polymerase elongation subunit (family B)